MEGRASSSCRVGALVDGQRPPLATHTTHYRQLVTLHNTLFTLTAAGACLQTRHSLHRSRAFHSAAVTQLTQPGWGGREASRAGRGTREPVTTQQTAGVAGRGGGARGGERGRERCTGGDKTGAASNQQAHSAHCDVTILVHGAQHSLR